MFYNKYISSFKKNFLKIIEICDNKKVFFYNVFFIIYFLLYYILTIPPNFNDENSNFYINKIKNNKIKFIIFLIVIHAVYVGLSIFLIHKYKENKFISILIPIYLTSIICYIDVLFLNKYLLFISELKIIKYIFIILSSVFYIIFFTIFLFNINNDSNIEFYISLIILFIFLITNIINSSVNINKIYSLLKNNDYSTLTINCSNYNNSIEKFEDNSINNFDQIDAINKKYGDNYLKTVGNIPIAFYNSYLKEYQDLFLADFYYPGSYFSYLADTPLNGTPSLEALKIALTIFKVRVIHLDIFSDKTDEFDPNANPIVRCTNMKDGASPLNLDDVFGLINKFAWITENNNLSYPLFLYLNFNFNLMNEKLCIKIYESLIKFFSKYLVDKKYSFSGRNSNFPISTAKIKECLGKIIIITNEYPTKTVLDELINTSNNNLNNSFELKEYKQLYVTYDEIGLSQDNDKTELVTDAKININFYYTLANDSKKNNNQPKAGLFNPSFQDCAQYGIQGTLMYLFIPDTNLEKWNGFFKSKNNLNPVLKDELLRYVIKNKNEIKKQDPMLGLQKSQKYCVVPGLISTEKSNLSTGSANPSC
jgi:hypothetical protein